MRIAISYLHRRIVGGLESYLSILLPALIERGHEVGFFHELEGPLERPLIWSSLSLATWSVSALGSAAALAALSKWRPQIIFNQGLQDPALEAELLKIGRVVFFGHAYYGTCVSEAKSFKFPTKQPCDRQLGLGCLAHYYPHRCGGLNPVTMLRQYGLQSRRLALLRQYRAVLVASSHMAKEYARHGCEGVVSVVPYPVPSPPVATTEISHSLCEKACHLLFLGRLEPVKGVELLFAALPMVSEKLGRAISVTLAGDGTERRQLELHSAEVQKANPQIKIRFTGWIEKDVREQLLQTADLLVIPSIWPEPFGMVGVEAGHFGVPSAAFNVGGIADWLKDGINGHLASAKPTTARGLAEAINGCLSDATHYLRLQQGAREMARSFKIATHVAQLERIFEKVLRSGSVTSQDSATTAAPGTRFKRKVYVQ